MKPKIIIEIVGGCISDVTVDQDVEVYVFDFDSIEGDEQLQAKGVANGAGVFRYTQSHCAADAIKACMKHVGEAYKTTRAYARKLKHL